MDDLQMEHGFLKAPWEVLLRNFRAGHKPLAKDIDQFSSSITKLTQQMIINTSTSSTSPSISLSAINDLENRLKMLKQKFDITRAADEYSMRRCYARISHLQTKSLPDTIIKPPSSEGDNYMLIDNDQSIQANHTNNNTSANGKDNLRREFLYIKQKELSPDLQPRWEKLRLDRALVDYMLREGMYKTAETLTESHSLTNIVDSDIFQESRIVIEALRKRDCSEALRWCNDNKRRLQKIQSKLEFRLRLQEFVEHARAGRKTDAIHYMKKFLASSNCSSERLLDIQRFMTLLAFEPTTSCQPYKDMYSERKWVELEVAFKQDNYRLHGLSRESTIEILLKAGLASVKTRKCGTESNRKLNCPTCVEPYLSLAQSLPRARHEHSILVCSISGEIMDENNPPMALPNGNVYSRKALVKIAESNEGTIIDPKTNDRALMDELRKCFIM